MMKKLILLCFICICNFLSCQIYHNPVTYFTYYNAFDNDLRLHFVETNENYTTLNITYQSSENSGWWPKISEKSFLYDVDTKTKYFFKKAEYKNVSQEKINLQPGEKLNFTLFFEKIPQTCRLFHFIEEELNYYNYKILNICLDVKQIDYTPYLKETQSMIHDYVLTYFTDGGSWAKYEKVYYALKEESKTNSKLNKFSITKEIDDMEEGLVFKYYTFYYGGTKIMLEKNLTHDTNRMIYLIFEDDYTSNRFITCLENILYIKKNENGFYTFPNRVIDLISTPDSNVVTYYSAQ